MSSALATSIVGNLTPATLPLFRSKTATDTQGRFELKFIRPGQQYIQADPFWLNPVDGKNSGSVELLLKPGETKVDVELKLPPVPKPILDGRIKRC